MASLADKQSPDYAAHQILSQAAYDIQAEWTAMLAECESPIERLLMAAMIDRGMAPSIRRQVPFGPYRIDMAIWRGDDVMVAVEADGWDWHYLTKEQVKRDHARDRYLQTHGWMVLRFTGSQIVDDPFWVADEVKECATNRFFDLHKAKHPEYWGA